MKLTKKEQKVRVLKLIMRFDSPGTKLKSGKRFENVSHDLNFYFINVKLHKFARSSLNAGGAEFCVEIGH